MIAAYSEGRKTNVLCSWRGHKTLIWVKAIGRVPQTGVEPALPPTSERYTMNAGSLKADECCEDCGSYSDGFDYGLVVDAENMGNVRDVSFLEMSFLCVPWTISGLDSP